jgi:hypothetical protein
MSKILLERHSNKAERSASTSAPTISEVLVPAIVEKGGPQGMLKVLLNAYTYTKSNAPLTGNLEEDHPRQEEAVTEPKLKLKDREDEHNAKEAYALSNIDLPQ